METQAGFSQRLRLLDHLRSGLPITAHQALIGYSCMRLAARIGELREAGWQIESKRIRATNRAGKKVWVAEYRLSQEAA